MPRFDRGRVSAKQAGDSLRKILNTNTDKYIEEAKEFSKILGVSMEEACLCSIEEIMSRISKGL